MRTFYTRSQYDGAYRSAGVIRPAHGRRVKFSGLGLAIWSGDQLTSIFGNALTALDGARHLLSSEKRWRLAALCQGRVFTPQLVSSIVSAAPGLSPGMRLAFAGLLPEAIRQNVYKASAAAGAAPITEQSTQRWPVVPPVEPAPVATSPVTSQQALDVVILSTADHDATANLLRSGGFLPLIIKTHAELIQLLQGGPDICGFIVDGSFWAKLKRRRPACRRPRNRAIFELSLVAH